MMFTLPPLPYAYDALEPAISGDTLHLHHDKHHAKYVETTNELLAKETAARSLEEVVRAAAGDPKSRKLHQNAAQAWNHAFFWACMTPEPGAPADGLLNAINDAFGGATDLKTTFVTEGVGHFASGWVWLAAEGGKLKVLSTHDDDNLLTQDGVTPLLVCDLWEHAYYLDYQNDRKAYLEAWLDKVADWAFAGRQFDAATGNGEAWRYPSSQPLSASGSHALGRAAV